MKFLFDTNAVIALFKAHGGLLTRVRQYQPEDFAVSSLVAHELYFGAYRSQRTVENLARVEALQFEVLEFDREDARRAGELRALLAASGSPIGPYDFLIAGQAIARGLTLISRNIGEFQRVGGMRVEDWEA